MNILPGSKRAAILAALCEGASIRATARMVRVSRTTVLKLLVEVGELCATYQDVALRNLRCRQLEIDETWAFVGAKARRATRAGEGDIWTFTAIDAESKLLVCWLVGDRSPETAHTFMQDVAARLTRLTNPFMKKAENHAHAFALFAMYRNYCRPHETLTKARGGIHTTAAMAAGVTDSVWKVEDILARMDPTRLP